MTDTVERPPALVVSLLCGAAPRHGGKSRRGDVACSAVQDAVVTAVAEHPPGVVGTLSGAGAPLWGGEGRRGRVAFRADGAAVVSAVAEHRPVLVVSLLCGGVPLSGGEGRRGGVVSTADGGAVVTAVSEPPPVLVGSLLCGGVLLLCGGVGGRGGAASTAEVGAAVMAGVERRPVLVASLSCGEAPLRRGKGRRGSVGTTPGPGRLLGAGARPPGGDRSSLPLPSARSWPVVGDSGRFAPRPLACVTAQGGMGAWWLGPGDVGAERCGAVRGHSRFPAHRRGGARSRAAAGAPSRPEPRGAAPGWAAATAGPRAWPDRRGTR